MIRITDIIKTEKYSITCRFNSGEVRKLDFQKTFEERKSDKYIVDVLNTNVFDKVKIGEFGQLYWENAAKIKDLNGELIDCEYDLSSEFFYNNSTKLL